MRKIVIIFVLSLFLYFGNIPSYVELNDLIIINKIDVICDNNKYKIEFQEIIPSRDENGIIYNYKIYSSDYFSNLNSSYNNLFGKINNKIYSIKKIKIETNCSDKNMIKSFFNTKNIDN